MLTSVPPAGDPGAPQLDWQAPPPGGTRARLWRWSKFWAVAVAFVVAIGTISAVRAVSAGAAVPCAAGTTVRTAGGLVCGFEAGGARQWRGIPYAAPPVGQLRWQAPQPHARWHKTLNATAYAARCIQPWPDQDGGPAKGTSENCLYLNIWAPRAASLSASLPVLVHIHGGGFFTGSGNGDYSVLAARGHVVVVSVNYRLGIFGFLANSALGPHAGDYGLEDQQAALRWVHANIAAFGGNPASVTIFGESAGGSSVCDQLASPTARGLFGGAITESGQYNTLLGTPAPSRAPNEDIETQDCKSALPSQARADRAGARFAAVVGCGPGTASVARCLRHVPAARLTRASDSPGDGYQFGGAGTIAPTINGSTLTVTLRTALATGKLSRVPVMAGTGRDEDLSGWPGTRARYQQLVGMEYGSWAPQVLARYPLAHYGSAQIAFRTLAADSDTICPALAMDAAMARWMPVYAYEIDDADLPPYTAPRVPDTPGGAAHVGGWFLGTVRPGLDADQQALQNQEIAEVAAFARYRNPSARGTLPWPEFGQSRAEMSMQAAGDSEMMPVSALATVHNCAFWDRITPRP
ncbi:MAG TPA: carboxylesterase family protein [Streptosporangiaceae bacterium]|nr:carboxylesterase family protein [Streptosporangiaceae bacterium]